MTDYKKFYASQADQYERLVAREDWQGNLLPALEGIRPLTNLSIVELGAGTGRVTHLLAPHAHQIISLDISPHMLGRARTSLTSSTLLKPEGPVHLAVADNCQLPIVSEIADIALAGWSLGHFVGWYPNDWRDRIGQALAEMKRVLRPGGTVILIETLGTGYKSPQPPHEGLAAYYEWLEEELDFTSTWIRTDYCFASVSEGDALTRPFFGNDLADHICRKQITILPECTGLWWSTYHVFVG